MMWRPYIQRPFLSVKVRSLIHQIGKRKQKGETFISSRKSGLWQTVEYADRIDN